MTYGAVISFALALLCYILVLLTVATVGPVNLAALGAVFIALGLLLAHLPYRTRQP